MIDINDTKTDYGEPSQEEKWEAEAALAYSQLPEALRPNKPGFIDGFLAAKKGGEQ